LHTNHVPVCIMINLDECSCTHTLSISCEVASASKGSHNIVESCTQDMYRPRAAVIVDDVLAASRLFLRRISRYNVGGKRKHLLEDIVVFLWLDHRE
jgi:hypothetical protein